MCEARQQADEAYTGKWQLNQLVRSAAQQLPDAAVVRHFECRTCVPAEVDFTINTMFRPWAAGAIVVQENLTRHALSCILGSLQVWAAAKVARTLITGGAAVASKVSPCDM